LEKLDDFSVGRPVEQATQPPRPCMQTVWNVLTIRCTRKLLKRLGAEAIIDPVPSQNLIHAKSNILNRARTRPC
jgi:hypothetical protein